MVASATAENAAGSKGAPVVYLVDDEPLLIGLGEALLQSDGYLTRAFQDPESAWKSFLSEEVKPRLLVSDFSMGGTMTGLELMERCKRADPTLKTLLVSGSVTTGELQQKPSSVDAFLPKPYKAADFVSAVRRLLAV